MIKVDNLTKKYKDVVAVDNVSLEILDGEIFALLGVNGAGKTTLIKNLTALTSATNGGIYYDGLALEENIEHIKKDINVSPQETAVAETLTVKENLVFIAQIYGMDKLTAQKSAENVIAEFGLQEVKNKKAKLLSGGTQRRLSIAMALITNPKTLFLDEPTLGLDVLSRAELWQLISGLKGKMTVVLTTHYMEEAEALADRVAIMDKGKIIALDTPKNLIAKTNSQNLEQAFIKIARGEI